MKRLYQHQTKSEAVAQDERLPDSLETVQQEESASETVDESTPSNIRRDQDADMPRC